jgi:hypothetical protein
MSCSRTSLCTTGYENCGSESSEVGDVDSIHPQNISCSKPSLCETPCHNADSSTFRNTERQRGRRKHPAAYVAFWKSHNSHGQIDVVLGLCRIEWEDGRSKRKRRSRFGNFYSFRTHESPSGWFWNEEIPDRQVTFGMSHMKCRSTTENHAFHLP